MQIQKLGVNTTIFAIQNNGQEKLTQKSHNVTFQGTKLATKKPLASFFKKFSTKMANLFPPRIKSPFVFEFKTYEELTKGQEGKDFIIKQLKRNRKDVEIFDAKGSNVYKYQDDKLRCVLEYNKEGTKIKGYEIKKDGSVGIVREYSPVDGKRTKGMYFGKSEIHVVIDNPETNLELKSYKYTNKGKWEEYNPAGRKVGEYEKYPEHVTSD